MNGPLLISLASRELLLQLLNRTGSALLRVGQLAASWHGTTNAK